MTAGYPLHRPRHIISCPLRVSTEIALLLVLIGAGTIGLSSSAQAEPGFTGQYSGRGEGLVTLTHWPPTRDARGEGYRLTAKTAIGHNCTGL